MDASVPHAVVLAGDAHHNRANDVRVHYEDPASPEVGWELVCTAITSTGNGSGTATGPVMAWNPRLKFYIDNRG